MTSYAKVKWNIIEKWNSDAKYSNSYLIDLASDIGEGVGGDKSGSGSPGNVTENLTYPSLSEPPSEDIEIPVGVMAPPRYESVFG